jgi:predicted negative regulator of RcsB-dependent stress response
VALVVVLVGGNYYSYYTATKNDQAAQQLTQALLLAAGEQRVASLRQITVDFARTGSARWAQVTLVGDYLGQKEYGQAIGILQRLIGDVDRDNPLFPLVQQLAGVAYELNGQPDEALSHYTTLSSVPGFEALGSVESGRVYELQGMAAKAKDAYEKANASPEMRPEQRAWVQEKIKTL